MIFEKFITYLIGHEFRQFGMVTTDPQLNFDNTVNAEHKIIARVMVNDEQSDILTVPLKRF